MLYEIRTLPLILLTLTALGGGTQVYQSVSFESFPSNTVYKEQPGIGISGTNVTYTYPNPMPPTNPAHDDKQKFGMHCDSTKNCQVTLTVNMDWWTSASIEKTCALQVTLGVNSSGSKTHAASTSGECTYEKTSVDGVEVWEVHPQVRRQVSITFNGFFNPIDAAIWSNQIYAHLNSEFKNSTDSPSNQIGFYTLSSDGTQLTFNISTEQK